MSKGLVIMEVFENFLVDTFYGGNSKLNWRYF